MIKVLVLTGLRHGELAQLKFSDIDWESRVLRVVSDKTRKTKNRRARLIPMSTDLEQELRFLKENWPNMQFSETVGAPKFRPRTDEQREYVFCHRDGQSVKCFKKSIATVLTKAGIAGVTPHGLRKTFCSLLARKGVHPKAAQRLMGHADMRMTMDIYTHVEDDQLRSAVDLLPSEREMRKQKLHLVEAFVE